MSDQFLRSFYDLCVYFRHLTYCTKYYQRFTLESWSTNLEQTTLNRCQLLPAPYKRLLDRKPQPRACSFSAYNIAAIFTGQKCTNHHSPSIITNHITLPTTNHNKDQSITTFVCFSNRHLTLKMTSAQDIDTPVNSNSLSQDYFYPDDQIPSK